MRIDCVSDAPEAVTADVAIVGSGAAGQSAARRLLGSGHSVVLIESGGPDYDAAAADLDPQKRAAYHLAPSMAELPGRVIGGMAAALQSGRGGQGRIPGNN